MATGAQQDTNSPWKKQDPNGHEKAVRAQQETGSPRKTSSVLLDTGSIEGLIFMKKGSTMCIPVIRAPLGARAYPWIVSKYLCVCVCVSVCPHK